MKLDLQEERIRFDFPAALCLYKFDERDKHLSTFHGAPMKAVDVMAEFPDFQLWIEIKEFMPTDIKAMNEKNDKEGRKYDKSGLTKNLKLKFRDTFLYRYCEEKLDKGIIYVCLTNLPTPLNLFYKKELKNQLPTGKPTDRWRRILLKPENIIVLNIEDWERNLKQKFGECEKMSRDLGIGT